MKNWSSRLFKVNIDLIKNYQKSLASFKKDHMPWWLGNISLKDGVRPPSDLLGHKNLESENVSLRP